mmetsp:Transcript_49212/g.107036  ORF Transcript_49212/g.107036 Transcript_49212/m.107036 type:complete len:387 (+) Transcript_49212:86-1246(+)|eukprot:CAMPEP_0170613164 /NCGR_PEP_ID=MMETSP0224-20130122/24124_1 /TAXON_ID=285029 /ORGANISM="Togula jolla, Strain CCCM 725" /LENGTH=386 /DNA_ID=CAMNT_0010938743 /DNA_START=81 /DNA_END=1241 /DNA_ORIENTATION=-
MEDKALLQARTNHPDLADLLDELQKYAEAKLYHQLTQTLLKYLQSPPFAPTAAGAADELLDFFNGFVKPYESKFDKVRWVEILAIVCKPQTPEKAVDLIAPFEAGVLNNRDAKFLFQTLKAEKLTHGGQLEAAKELLDSLGAEIDAAYEVDALIQSHFHKTNALLWNKLSRPHEFYKSSILYLAFTPLAAIPAEERPQLAFEVGVAALVSEEEFDFGELMQQELLASLEGSKYEWLIELLKAFVDGKFEAYDAAIARHKAQIDGSPAFQQAVVGGVLTRKMAALALMELAFRKPKKQRRLTFDEVAQHCRVGPKEVEHLMMRAMCANLIRGRIDEVEQLLMITWVKPRILDVARIDLMRQRMDGWADQTGLLQDNLAEMTPELLVS